MLSNLVFNTVISYAVVKDQLHIVYELLNIMIDIESQLLFNGPKIHRLFDDIKVVIDSIATWVNRLVEVVSSF